MLRRQTGYQLGGFDSSQTPRTSEDEIMDIDIGQNDAVVNRRDGSDATQASPTQASPRPTVSLDQHSEIRNRLRALELQLATQSRQLFEERNSRQQLRKSNWQLSVKCEFNWSNN